MTDLMNCSRPAKDRVETAQELNLLTTLSIRGEYFDILSFLLIRGRPKYLIGKEQIENPELAIAEDSSGFRPTVNSWVLSQFISSPDQDANRFIVSEIPYREEDDPSKKTITSSANIRCEISS